MNISFTFKFHQLVSFPFLNEYMLMYISVFYVLSADISDSFMDYIWMCVCELYIYNISAWIT